MDYNTLLDQLPETGGTSFNQKTAVVWVENQPQELHFLLAQRLFQELLDHASRPKQSSGNACSKLCGFVENCSRSTSHGLRELAFAEETAGKLFDYFIEWNEQDAHRSMRLVLDFIVFSIRSNPDPTVAQSIRNSILRDTVSVITLEASRPSTKSSMIALDHLVQKKIVYLGEILTVYQDLQTKASGIEATWDSLISRVFAWMELQYVWTVAGKLLVTIFTNPWYPDRAELRHGPDVWHAFILDALRTNPELLDPVKVYVFMPLFKADPTAALLYLKKLTSLQKLTAKVARSWDHNAMIWVAMLEAGKKTGVISDPDNESTRDQEIAGQLPLHMLDIILSHQSHEARASGLSILLASPTTSRPYSTATLDLLRRHIPSFYEDVDPKVRYGVLGHSRNMVRRLLTTIESLRKEMARTTKKADSKSSLSKDPQLKSGETDRQRQGVMVVSKESDGQKLSDTLHEHERFLEWYASFLKAELAPTASYQRHITSLRAMSFFLRYALVQGDIASVGRWPATLLVDAVWFRSVLDLVSDPYDDVRENAASLIMLLQCGKSMSRPLPLIQDLSRCPFEELRDFCQRAEELAQKTARADHCDGAARSQELLCLWSPSLPDAAEVLASVLSNLEQKLLAAERDLATAVLGAPVHGDFASLRYIWSALTSIKHSHDALEALYQYQDRSIVCCKRVWRAVQHILCDDSPEGHLPEELEQVEGLDTKDLLSYSFRAVHESSNLMRIIAQNARGDQTNGLLAPSCQNFEDIGRLTFEQLSTLRHRGAFSTVSQTFTTCCQLVQVIQAQRGSNMDLLDDWYKGALDCIHTQASLTRRSAGIPAIIVGVLASKADKPSFEDVMTRLQEIGREPAYVSKTDGSNLSQVHALNCLKDVFKTSFLSHRAAPYLTDCLQLAAQSLQSELWAIRNCGLLFLRSLIDNLFGMNESKLAMEAGWDGRTIRISYNKYKALPDLLINLLELGKQSSGMVMGTQTAEAVFPALDIIRRAGPPDGYRDKLFDCITWYLGSRIWHVREIAARTLCSLLLTPVWLQSIEPLLVTGSGKSANKLHGGLLTLKFLLERLLQVMPDQLRGDNIALLRLLLLDKVPNSCHSFYTCSETQAVYIDILNFLEKLAVEDSTSTTPFGSSDTPHNPQDDGPSYGSMAIVPGNKSEEPLALLSIRTGQMTIWQILKTPLSKDKVLGQELHLALMQDVNVACAMLEAISKSGIPPSHAARLTLIDSCVNVCSATEHPEPRTLALESLALLLDAVLASVDQAMSLATLMSEETVARLWQDLEKKPMNPGLSNAILRVSGSLIAICLLRSEQNVDKELGGRLRNWGLMMSDAGVAEQPFDTRIAAVEAINSLSSAVQLSTNSQPTRNHTSRLNNAHLPWLLALYDALIDDDVDVREAAAVAATPIIGSALVPVEAGSRLLHWLATSYGSTPEFRRHVINRMIGHRFGEGLDRVESESWIAAETQLEDAMRFDDSLFVIEEHNQYIDEVQEARRWANVFQLLELRAPSTATAETTDGGDDTNALGDWTLAGLRTLIKITQSEGNDGPLGWTSKPEVFAICARILMCATILKKCPGLGGPGGHEQDQAQDNELSDVGKELIRFREVGCQHHIHGLLLDMCDFER